MGIADWRSGMDFAVTLMSVAVMTPLAERKNSPLKIRRGEAARSWAALSAAHLAAILFPDALRRLYIVRDSDPAGDGARDTLMNLENRLIKSIIYFNMRAKLRTKILLLFHFRSCDGAA